MTTFNPYPDPLTGAELQTLREACGLSRDDLGALAGVAARSVKHWEHGRSGVPADVADIVRRLDELIDFQIDQARNRHITGPNEFTLIRYRDEDALAHYRPDLAGQPLGVHGAIVQRVAMNLRREGMTARVVWMVPDEYEAWRLRISCTLPDDDAQRAIWAAQQIQHQARAHRADQPPSPAA